MRFLQTTDRRRPTPQVCVILRHPGRLALFVSVAITCVFTAVPSPHTQASTPSEYEVKAAYLYNFGRFVQWPSKPEDNSFAICVVGQDPFGPALDSTLAGETLNGKSVVARRISRPQEALDCRILFISLSEDHQLKEVLGALDKTSVLTVSDMPQFAQRGGMVQFSLEGNKVRFEVNLTAAEHAGLTLSSQLLKLATNVRRSQPGA